MQLAERIVLDTTGPFPEILIENFIGTVWLTNTDVIQEYYLIKQSHSCQKIWQTF